jgi:soluble lytic murein transglycosylase-like protein
LIAYGYIYCKPKLTKTSSTDTPLDYLTSRIYYQDLIYFLNIKDLAKLKNTLSESSLSDVSSQFTSDLLSLDSIAKILFTANQEIIQTKLDSISNDDIYIQTIKNNYKLKLLFKKKQYQDYINYYHTDNFPKNKEYKLFLLQSYYHENQKDTAYEQFKQLFRIFPLQQLKSNMDQLVMKDLLNRIPLDVWNHKFNLLLNKNLFTDFLYEKQYVNAPQLINLFHAEFLYKQKKYLQAQSLLKAISSIEWLERKEQLLIRIDLRNDHIENGLKRIETVSDPLLLKDLLLNSAIILMTKGLYETSLILLNRYFQELKGDAISYSGQDHNFWKSLWLAAWINVKSRHYQNALKFFSIGCHATLNSYKIANIFWHSFFKKNDFQEIRQFPYSYYYTQKYPPNNHARQLQNFSQLLSNKPSKTYQAIIQNLKTMIDLNLIDEIIDYISLLKKSESFNTSEKTNLKLIESIIYLKQNKYNQAFNTYRSNFSDYEKMILPKFISAIYLPLPPAYKNIIDHYCKRYQINPQLVYSLIRNESFFRERIKSPANAYGLMQLLFSTAKRMAVENRFSIKITDLSNPAINIHLGIHYLRKLLNRYNQKNHLALAAYNAGENRVDRWLKEFDHTPQEKFIEMIPFTETRNYVKNILRDFYYYQIYYGK